jgi:hypothetical protein
MLAIVHCPTGAENTKPRCDDRQRAASPVSVLVPRVGLAGYRLMRRSFSAVPLQCVPLFVNHELCVLDYFRRAGAFLPPDRPRFRLLPPSVLVMIWLANR